VNVGVHGFRRPQGPIGAARSLFTRRSGPRNHWSRRGAMSSVSEKETAPREKAAKMAALAPRLPGFPRRKSY
jgi:hypothetical protein